MHRNLDGDGAGWHCPAGCARAAAPVWRTVTHWDLGQPRSLTAVKLYSVFDGSGRGQNIQVQGSNQWHNLNADSSWDDVGTDSLEYE